MAKGKKIPKSGATAAIWAKEKGNEAFKASKWVGAVQRYAEAEKISPTNPVYPSNLSAALFEMGDYGSCAAAILRACSRLDFEQDATLAARLSARLGRSLAQAAAAGSYIHPTEQIERIEKAGTEPAPWLMWRALAPSAARELEVEAARKCLLDLPILKQVPSARCEYFVISHDDVKSMLSTSSDFDARDATDTIELPRLPNQRLASLAFFYGGVGDARHAFGTLIGLHEASHEMTPAQRDAFRVHITLLDIKEHALARDLVVMFLLSKIMACTDTLQKLELQVTVFYLYTALIIPAYCHERLCDALAEIRVTLSQDPVHLLPWIRLDARSIHGIRSALDLWTNFPKRSTPNFMFEHEFSPEDDQNSPFHLQVEASWYAQTKTFLPPTELWDRHPEFSVSRELNGLKAKDRMRTAVTQIQKHWVVNPTLFDDPRKPDRDVLELIDGDTLSVVRQLAAFHKRHPSTPFRILRDSPAFGYVTGFFDSVIAALRALDGKIQLELIHGELQSELLRMRMQPASRLASNLPVSYTKMWLSNVPDYINGPMGTTLFVVPSLQDAESTTGANHLLSFPAFMEEPEAFSNTYAHLAGYEFPSYLGCRAIYMQMGDVTILAPLPLPRPNDTLAKREALKTWLVRVFLCTLINGRRNTTAKIITPNTLVTFMHLLIHLHRVGYPGHWLADFLQSVLANELVTNILPYTGVLPISLRHDWTGGRPDARLCLDPWVPDMEAIVARIRPALPFALALPASFLAPADVGRFSARVRCYPTAAALEPIAVLLFFDPSRVRLHEIRDWRAHLLAALRGEGRGKSTGIRVVSMDAMSWNEVSGEVWWRMSHARVEAMRAQNWRVVVYGTYECQIMSSDAAAATWTTAN
ncbi:hypothetical protein B0H15DRAFT_852172 [Mycena belliarum]|uniref:DUF4470 domain-containing protein n=1 Tax=Mycena belliarum TaxID=1033014 RepID=A0AAD6XN17_9AGAR|nr:hypothetical protein B0H15DRAFT_852172 [Mycena belliae]